MPYIKSELRPFVEDGVLNLAEEVKTAVAAAGGSREGIVNYTITTLLQSIYNEPKSYKNINEIVGVLESIKLEFYRRYAAPYEDKKAEQNGDVY